MQVYTTAEQAARDKTREVLAVGIKLGLWQHDTSSNRHTESEWVDVRTEDGLLFNFGPEGSFRSESLKCQVGTIHHKYWSISATDVAKYLPGGGREFAPEAKCSVKRSAEQIARDFYKRVVSDETARDHAWRIRETHANRLYHHKRLREHIAVLTEQGFMFHNISNSEHHRASAYRDAYHGEPTHVTINSNGDVEFKIDIPVEHLAQVTALLKSFKAAA